MTAPNIPKQIHYCWFGDNEMGEQEQKCIESWEKCMPGYEIIKWDETNFDIECNDYVREAYGMGKWAFVSDYARFKILYENGGLYFDTDVELLKSVEDLVHQGPFMACETNGDILSEKKKRHDGKSVNVGLGAAVYPGHAIYKEIIDSYDLDCFLKCDGTLNISTVVERTTEILRSHGLKNDGGVIQDIDGIRIYPKEYFNPFDFEKGTLECTSNTHSIHHYAMSWFEPSRLMEVKMRRKMLAIGVPSKVAKPICKAIGVFRYADYTRLLHAIKTKRLKQKTR